MQGVQAYRVRIHTGCARVWDVHACRVCMHTGFAHLQGVHAHRAYMHAGRACPQGVQRCARKRCVHMCGWREALGQDQAIL